MGADYVGWITPITRSREEALALLDAMSIEDILTRNEEFDTVLHHAVEDGAYDTSEGEDGVDFILDESQVRSRCREAVNIAYDCAEGEYRMASYMKYGKDGEVVFAIAGGASWGDTPEYVDDLCIADALRVTYDDTKELKWVDK
jgi:hypothetical protein